ncbi:MAG: recombinase family protein, partial [Firmicutes bacterium]|nr:recombinase family protein [Bacillota bacterium]
LKELKDYAKRNGMLIDPEHIYIDAGISGRKASKRPQFQKMVAVAKSKPAPFEAILVWKFSRFARNQEESILYKSLLRKNNGVDVISITEETGDSMFGSLIERIIEWMDEFYSIRLGEEVRAKMSYVAEKGRIQTVASFGYTKKSGEDLVINEYEAEWVHYMAEQVLEGKSLRRIANHLNDCGVITHRGNKFEPRTIDYILRNPINKGTIHWTPHQNHQGRTPISQDTILVDNAAPAIYDAKYHDKVVAELDRRATLHKKNAKSDTVKKHWLSGLLKCSNCGSSLVFQSANNGFQCYKYGKTLCDVSHFVNVNKMEASVFEALDQVTITDDFIKSVTKEKRPASVDFSKDIEKLEHMLERAKAAYVAGIDTLEEYGENKARLTREIEALRGKEVHNDIIYPPIEEVRLKFESITQLLKSDEDVDVKHRAISEIVEYITFSRPDDSVSIYFYL